MKVFYFKSQDALVYFDLNWFVCQNLKFVSLSLLVLTKAFIWFSQKFLLKRFSLWLILVLSNLYLRVLIVNCRSVFRLCLQVTKLIAQSFVSQFLELHIPFIIVIFHFQIKRLSFSFLSLEVVECCLVFE